MEGNMYSDRIARLSAGMVPKEAQAGAEPAAAEIVPQPPAKPAPEPKKNLSPAEKKALKLAKKEQKRLKELEAGRQQIRDHLLRELKYGKITYQRAFKSWQNMCRQIKLKELQEDLAVLWQNLNYIFDQKRFKVQLLYEDLVEAEQMHQRSFSKHIDILDFMTKMYKYMLKLMKDNYERVAEKMILEFYAETDEIALLQDNRKNFAENFVHLTNIAVKHNIDKLKFDFEIEERDAIDTNVEHQYLLKDDTVRKMTEMHNQIVQIVTNLQQETMDSKRQMRYNAFAEKNQASNAEFLKMGEATRKGWDVIVEVQKTLTKTENMYNFKLNGLKNEKIFYVEHYWRLRESYKKLMAQADQDVSLLAHESYKAIQELEKQKRYGELVLGLVQSCRKLQSEKEKVLPWPSHEKVASVIKGLEDADEETTRMLILQLFWYRVSRAQAHVLCLKKEKKDLELECAKYCRKLKSSYEVETDDKIIKSLILNPPVACIKQDKCPKCNLELP